jgi:hypothetical protein
MLNGEDNNNLNFLHPVYTKWLIAYMNVGLHIFHHSFSIITYSIIRNNSTDDCITKCIYIL